MDALWLGLTSVLVILPALGLEGLISNGWRPAPWLAWTLTVIGWAVGLAIFWLLTQQLGLRIDGIITTIMATAGLAISIIRVGNALQSRTPTGVSYDPSRPPPLPRR